MNIKKLIGLTVFISILTGCYKYPSIDAREEDRDITITAYDVNADFGTYTTFAIWDTVYRLKSVNNVDSSLILEDPYASTIKNEIKKQMQDRGYTLVDTSANPDLGILIHVTDTEVSGEFTNIECGYYPPYWEYGWGYDWDYGWGYPGYWDVCYPYTYSTYYYDKSGSVLIEMFDIKNKKDNHISIVWNASLRAYLVTQPIDTETRLKTGIKEAFNQSPYLIK